MDAASPAAKRGAREDYRPHPGSERQLTCPILDCADPDHLELIYAAKVYTPAALYAIDGITFPEIDEDRDTERTSINDGQRQIIGIRCATCRWSYEGPGPLTHLQRSP